MENSRIAWTHHTMNFFVGCEKVSPACDNCYAESWARRAGRPHLWQGKRERTKNWKEPFRWNSRCESVGIRERVFTNSLSDFFDNQADPAWRSDAWSVILDTPSLDWLILTKRPQNIAKMLPPNWGDGYPNVWLGTTVENQTEANRRIPRLLAIPAKVHFLSCEPLLGPLKIEQWLHDSDCPTGMGGDCCICSDPREVHVSWVICGGESGGNYRKMEIAWATDLWQQCRHAYVPFFFKQDSARQPGQRGHAGELLWNSKMIPVAA